MSVCAALCCGCFAILQMRFSFSLYYELLLLLRVHLATFTQRAPCIHALALSPFILYTQTCVCVCLHALIKRVKIHATRTHFTHFTHTQSGSFADWLSNTSFFPHSLPLSLDIVRLQTDRQNVLLFGELCNAFDHCVYSFPRFFCQFHYLPVQCPFLLFSRFST